MARRRSPKSSANSTQNNAPTTSLAKFNFHGDTLHALREGEDLWVVVKRICEALGVDEATQRRKLQRKAWAVAGLKPSTGPDGKTYESFAIHVDSLPMWLATIEPSRVRPEVRAKLERYQVECARVLRDHFLGKPNPEPRTVDAWEQGNARGELHDDPQRLSAMCRLIRCVAAVKNRSWQAVHGDLLRTYQIRTYKRLPCGLVGAAEKRLHDMIDGRVLLASKARRALPAAPSRQQPLFN